MTLSERIALLQGDVEGRAPPVSVKDTKSMGDMEWVNHVYPIVERELDKCRAYIQYDDEKIAYLEAQMAPDDIEAWRRVNAAKREIKEAKRFKKIPPSTRKPAKASSSSRPRTSRRSTCASST